MASKPKNIEERRRMFVAHVNFNDKVVVEEFVAEFAAKQVKFKDKNGDKARPRGLNYASQLPRTVFEGQLARNTREEALEALAANLEQNAGALEHSAQLYREQAVRARKLITAPAEDR